jgi:hypothetical protein
MDQKPKVGNLVRVANQVSMHWNRLGLVIGVEGIYCLVRWASPPTTDHFGSIATKTEVRRDALEVLS